MDNYNYKDHTNGDCSYTNTGADTIDFLKNTSPFKKNSRVPPPPKPGEIIHCQFCRKAMYPDDFSKDIKKRKFEFKWQVHWACAQAAGNYLDRLTPGLLSERKQYGISGTALVQRQLRKREKEKENGDQR